MSELQCICAMCGAERPRSEMGECWDDREIWFFCHPGMSTGETCYMRAPLWMDRT